jgi:hypothetical protein
MVTRAVLLLVMLCAPAMAAEVTPLPGASDLGVRIEALQYPANLPKELTSGLTSRLFVRVSLLDGGTVLQQHAAELAIRYDLWDETFTVTSTLEGRTIGTRVLPDLGQTTAFLAVVELPHVFVTQPLPPNRDLVIRAELLLNPIDREKLGIIRKWVAQNSTPQVGTDSAGTASNAIFNRIFEQYADGSQLAAGVASRGGISTISAERCVE